MTGSGRVAPDAPSKTFPTLANRAEGRGQPAGQPDSYGGTGSGRGGTGVATIDGGRLSEEEELVEDLLELPDGRRVDLEQEAVLAGDAVALGDLRAASRAVRAIFGSWPGRAGCGRTRSTGSPRAAGSTSSR